MVITKWLVLLLGLFLLITTSLVQSLPNENPSENAENQIYCGGVRAEETSWLGDVIDPQPEDEPNRDRSTWRPFQTFVVPADPKMSTDESKLILEAGEIANARLSPLLKSWHLSDVRTPRRWDGVNERCHFPNVCGSSTIPPEYHQPCLSQSSNDKQIIVEPGVPQDEDFKSTTYALVLFVNIPGTPRVDDCGRYTSAYSTICFWDKKTFRPTHGSINLCKKPSQLSRLQLADVIMHHIVHIMTRGTMLGYYNPNFRNPDRVNIERRDIEGMKLRARYKTWRKLTLDWSVRGKQGASLGQSKHDILAAASPAIMQIVRQYFACNDDRRVRGAETALIDMSSANFDADNPMDESHWSMRLFPDELMTPIRTGYPKISKLTLQILQETDWYDADLNAGQNLMFNYSSIRPKGSQGMFNGCSVASDACFKLFRRPSGERPGDKIPEWSGPICQRESISTDYYRQPLCSDDGRYLLLCSRFDWASSGCDVLHVPVHHEFMDPDCREGTWETKTAREFGMSISPQSTCLTMMPLSKLDTIKVAEKVVFSGCFKYECSVSTSNAFHFNFKQNADLFANCQGTKVFKLYCGFECADTTPGGLGLTICPDICGIKANVNSEVAVNMPQVETTAAPSGSTTDYNPPSSAARIGFITIFYRAMSSI